MATSALRDLHAATSREKPADDVPYNTHKIDEFAGSVCVRERDRVVRMKPCVCVCVCVRERERDGVVRMKQCVCERERRRGPNEAVCV